MAFIGSKPYSPFYFLDVMFLVCVGNVHPAKQRGVNTQKNEEEWSQHVHVVDVVFRCTQVKQVSKDDSVE